MITKEQKQLAEDVYRMILMSGMQYPSLHSPDDIVFSITETCQQLGGISRSQLARLSLLAGISEQDRPMISKRKRGYSTVQISMIRAVREGEIARKEPK